MQTNYQPGHAMHFIHGRRIGETPWGWREGVVRESGDGTHVVDYVFDDGSITLWSDRLDRLPLGTPVRVHEGYYALDVAGALFNVRKDSPGLGAVPEPQDPSLWAHRVHSVAVGVADGIGHILPPRRKPAL